MANRTTQRLAHLLEPASKPTPEENLRRAIELSDLGLAVKAEQLARQHPDQSPTELARLYQQWLLYRSEAPGGDFPGPARQALNAS